MESNDRSGQHQIALLLTVTLFGGCVEGPSLRPDAASRDLPLPFEQATSGEPIPAWHDGATPADLSSPDAAVADAVSALDGANGDAHSPAVADAEAVPLLDRGAGEAQVSAPADGGPPDSASPTAGGCRDPQPASILLCLDWEITSFDAQADVKRSLSHPNDDWVEVSAAARRAGRKSLRVHLDYDGPDGAEFRSEISDHSGPSAPLVLGRPYWIGFSIYVPSDWQADPADWDNQVMWQTHTSASAPSNTSPGTALRIRNHQWVASLKYDLDDGAGVQTRSKSLAPVVPGTWNDFVVQVRYDVGSTGILKVWKDQRAGDAPLWDYRGPTTSVGDTGGYNKFGLYHTGWKFNVPTSHKVHTYYFDEIRIGNENASFEQVAPGR